MNNQHTILMAPHVKTLSISTDSGATVHALLPHTVTPAVAAFYFTKPGHVHGATVTFSSFDEPFLEFLYEIGRAHV